MLRELAEALEVLTATRPLVLVLEDLHWSDRATLEWLAYVVRRRDAARLLLLGTYRPVEVMVSMHPLRAILAALRHHPQYAELRLDALCEAAVVAYLRQRCGTEPVPPDLPQLVHQRTGGHPLFLVTMVDELVRQRLLERVGDAGGSPEDLAVLRGVLPASLRQYIEQHLEQVSEADQALLEAASVAGSTFAVAAVAAGVTRAPEILEARYTALARQGQFIQANGIETWPDGTVTACYQFRHALYHEVVYARVSAGHLVHLHQQIGMRIETGYGARAHEIAAELAVHFERGRDSARAIRYLQHAADSALRRSAYTDAITHLTNALALLSALPDTTERAQQERDVQLALGPALMVTKGMAAREVEQTYARARTLCAQVGETPQAFLALRGLCSFYENRGLLPTARELRAQLLRLAQRQAAPTYLLEAHIGLGTTLGFLGEYAAARTHLEQASAFTDPREQPALALRRGAGAAVMCLAHLARTLWALGYPAQALRQSQAALTLAQELAHPYSLAYARSYAVILHYLRRDASAVLTEADGLLTCAHAQGFPFWEAAGRIYQGWALAMQGEREVGLAQLRQGLAAVLATGEELSRPAGLLLLAEAAGHTGQVAEGLRLLAEALTAFEASGRADVLAEAYRLQGALLLRQAVPDAAQVEACFQQALAVARRQEAKTWELRAATSLGHLWQQQGKRAEARELLRPISGWFTEGFDTADLQEAKALMEALEGEHG
jgi:predicted ATPase